MRQLWRRFRTDRNAVEERAKTAIKANLFVNRSAIKTHRYDFEFKLLLRTRGTCLKAESSFWWKNWERGSAWMLIEELTIGERHVEGCFQKVMHREERCSESSLYSINSLPDAGLIALTTREQGRFCVFETFFARFSNRIESLLGIESIFFLQKQFNSKLSLLSTCCTLLCMILTCTLHV